MIINLDKIKKLRKLLVLIPYKYRFVNPKEFKRYFAILNRLENATKEEVEEYQYKTLRSLIDIAYNETEFYREKYDKAGFNPSMFNKFSDIQKIPILTRDELKNNSKKMLRQGRRIPLLKAKTSGTSGRSVEIFYDRLAFSREWATLSYIWKRVGYEYGMGRVEFRAMMEKGDYEFFPETRVLRINILKMNIDNIDKILHRIKKSRYQFFHGYPSAIYKFSRLLQSRRDYVQPKAILFSSEILYDWQLSLISSVFPNSSWIDFYGMAEHVCIAMGNTDHSYSFIPAYGITEFTGDNNEIIGTSLTNFVMPLIRYKLSDTVKDFFSSSETQPQALFPVVKNISGRIADYTYNSQGDIVPPAVVTFPFRDLKHIRSCKIIQNSLSDFSFIVEGIDNSETRDEAKRVLEELKLLYGSTAKFSVIIKPELLPNSSGKFRWIECRYNPNNA